MTQNNLAPFVSIPQNSQQKVALAPQIKLCIFKAVICGPYNQTTCMICKIPRRESNEEEVARQHPDPPKR